MFNSTEIASDVTSDSFESINGFHINYYCTPLAFGVAHLSLTIQFANCPDLLIAWQKVCGTKLMAPSGINLDMMVGGTGHYRFPLIVQGVENHPKKTTNHQPGSLDFAGYDLRDSKKT